MNSEIRSRLEALGRPLTPPMMIGTTDCFKDLHTAQAAAQDNVERNVRYGPHDRQRVDVFLPTRGNSVGRPVLLFVHGGGFVAGDKCRPDTPFYDNVGRWAVANGCIGVTMNYRLAPEFTWPIGGEDVGRAIEWLALNVARIGGDPHKIFVMGQSAGAVHAADYISMTRLHRSAGRALKGAMLISGLYDLSIADRNEYQLNYYGSDYASYPQRSALPGLLSADLPLLLTVSEFDPEDFHRQAAAYVSGVAILKDCYPRVLYLQGHNHLSSVLQIGTTGDTLGPELIHFIQYTCG